MLEQTIDVRRVGKRDTQAQQAIFQLRYHVYNNVLKHHAHAGMDHVSQTLSDVIEDKSALFLSRVNDVAVGSIRMTLFDDIESTDNVILSLVKELPAHYLEQKCALLSMYCILPEYNNTQVTQTLLHCALSHALRKKVQRFFVAAPEYLLEYYNHYHFKACSEWCQPEGYPLAVKVMTSDTQSLIALEP